MIQSEKQLKIKYLKYSKQWNLDIVGNYIKTLLLKLLVLMVLKLNLELKDKWVSPFYNFLKENGYEYNGVLHNENLHPDEKYNKDFVLDAIKNHPGVNGLFYASVYSPRYYYTKNNTTHAVIVDKDFNIIHDPNSDYCSIHHYPEADKLKYNGILNIWLIDPIKIV